MKEVTCEIICVGTEILLGDILNTNSQYLAKGLAQLGINVFYQTVVGDNPDRLAMALSIAKRRADIIITTGGLGPTCDDLTKETVASSFGRKLVMDEAYLKELTDFFSRLKRPMTENNKKQAMMPEGCIVIPNPQGTAPGYIIESDDGKAAIMMPGPPREMEPMFDNSVKPYLRRLSENILVSRVVRMIGIGESAMEAKLIDLMESMHNPTLAPYARTGECFVRITAKAHDEKEAYALIDPQVQEIRRRLGDCVYGVDVDSLEQHLVGLLGEKGLTLAIFEIGTDGHAIKRVYDAEGASRVMKLGLTAPELKEASHFTWMPSNSLNTENEPLKSASELSRSVRELAGTDFGAVIIREAGMVFIGISRRDAEAADSYAYPQARSSDYIFTLAANRAFDMIRRLVSR